jgi:hypothetical protein
VLDWIKGRRQSGEERRRKLLLALARAEEALVETHVRNALELHDALEDDLSLEDALATYLDALVPSRTEAEIVARRVLTRAQIHVPASAVNEHRGGSRRGRGLRR